MSGRVRDRSLLVRVLTSLAGFLLASALAGVLWERVWEAPAGLVYKGEWFLEPAGPDVAFQAAALYVVIALPLGLLLAVLCSLRPGHEVVTVITVLVAAAIGALVMYAVGHGLGPPDPQALASGKPDYTAVVGDLVLGSASKGSRPWASTALLAMPAGAMAGLVGMYLLGRGGLGKAPRG